MEGIIPAGGAGDRIRGVPKQFPTVFDWLIVNCSAM